MFGGLSGSSQVFELEQYTHFWSKKQRIFLEVLPILFVSKGHANNMAKCHQCPGLDSKDKPMHSSIPFKQISIKNIAPLHPFCIAAARTGHPRWCKRILPELAGKWLDVFDVLVMIV